MSIQSLLAPSTRRPALPVHTAAISRETAPFRGAGFRAQDLPRVHAVGNDTQRTILLGHSALMNVGVTTHELGLPGFLARRLRGMTNCGQTVDVAVTSAAGLGGITTAVASQPLWRFDSIVICLSLAELRWSFLHPSWKADSVELIATLDAVRSVGTTAVIAVLLSPDQPAGQRAIAEQLAAECSRSGSVEFVEISPTPGRDDADRDDLAPTYDDYAELIADRMVESMTAALPGASAWTDAGVDGSARAKRRRPQPEQERQSAVDALTATTSAGDPELHRMMTLLKTAYGTEHAALNIVDGDSAWSLAVGGGGLPPLPRSESFCAVTIHQDTPMVIPDASADILFQGYLPVASGFLGFYAGMAIESPEGLRVGALCVFDSQPRSGEYFNPMLLMTIAHYLETLLWNGAVA